MQVATAVRLCDGALVVVDAVEGLCVQTLAVLKQAWAERVTPTLVINKLDRLITELELDEEQAYERLVRIVDEANAVFSSMASVEFLQTADTLAEEAGFECAPALLFVCTALLPARPHCYLHALHTACVPYVLPACLRAACVPGMRK